MPLPAIADPLSICRTGIAGFDDVLGGGLPQGCLYLIDGEPGTGKTTLALQFLLEGISKGERCLYIGLSETRREIENVALSHGWNLSKLEILDLTSLHGLGMSTSKSGAQGTVFQPAEVELNQTTQGLLDAIERVQAQRVVFDSVSEMRLLAGSSMRYRRQVLALKQHLSKTEATVLFLDDRSASEGEFQVKSIVHGVMLLESRDPDFGVELRRLKIVKLRGVKYRGGYHDYIIERGGLRIFPRLVASEHYLPFKKESISSGIKELDALLGGGLDRASSNLFLGPAGTGKSTLAVQFACAAAGRGERVALFVFEENVGSLLIRSKEVGIPLQKLMDTGMVIIEKIDPAGKSPGQFTDDIRTLVETQDIKLVLIDSLNGYLHAMPQENYLTMQLHELLAYLAHRAVTTIIVLAQQGLMGMMNTPIDLTYLADTVLITRYFETQGSVRKAVSVIKKRTGSHEDTIRELTIKPKGGITVGKPLKQFDGVLTGVPSIARHGVRKSRRA